MSQANLRKLCDTQTQSLTEKKMTNTNFVKEAIHTAGGPSRVAAQLRVSSRTVSNWQAQGFVPNYYRAEELAALSNVPVSTLRKPG